MTADRAVDVAAKALAEPWEFADGSDDPPLDVFHARAVVAALRGAGLLLPEPAERHYTVAYEWRGPDGTEHGTVRYSVTSHDAGVRALANESEAFTAYDFRLESRLVGPWTRAEPETGGGE